MAYVMLGRSQLLEDIYIVETTHKFDPNDIRVNPEALAESERIHEAFEKLKLEEEELYEEFWTFTFLNVNRLLPHIKHIRSDDVMMKSDIFALGETWLQPGQHVDFEGFIGSEIVVGNGKGLSAFVKSDLDDELTFENYQSEKFSAILVRALENRIVFLYLSQGYNYQELTQLLKKWTNSGSEVAVIGDFNTDFRDKDEKLVKFFEHCKFSQLITKSTHSKGGMIDLIYVNSSMMKKTLKTSHRSVYYSDHDVISLHIGKC